MEKSSLVLDIFPISEKLNSREVRSASQYILLYHLTRGLVSLSKDGRIQGSLAKSWQISENHTKIVFTLKPTEKFSNGELITAKDVANTILWQKKNTSSIHVEFSQINKVSALDNEHISIWLNEPNSRFLEKLCHVEFGVLHSSDILSNIPSYKISSGRYSLNKLQHNNAILLRNKFAAVDNSFNEIKFQSSDIEHVINGLQNDTIDFSISYTGKEKYFSALTTTTEKIKKLTPHIGFTHWLTFNPLSKVFKNYKNRAKVFSLINELKNSDFELPYEKADQIYLPGGPGRLSKDEIKEAEDLNRRAVPSSTLNDTIKILLPSNLPFAQNIVQTLNVFFKHISVITYSTQDEFVQKNNRNIDMFITNNDFSSLDLAENLFVAFNKNRPLIYANEEIKELLKKIDHVDIDEDRYVIYRAIGQSLLKNALVVPLFYDRVNFYYSNRLDLSEWSILFPEIATWKIKNK